MVHVETLFVLLDLSHGFEFFLVVAWQVFYVSIGSNKLNLVLLANDFSSVFGFIVLLRNVP